MYKKLSDNQLEAVAGGKGEISRSAGKDTKIACEVLIQIMA